MYIHDYYLRVLLIISINYYILNIYVIILYVYIIYIIALNMNNGRVSLDTTNAHRYELTDNSKKELFRNNYVAGVKKTPTYDRFFSKNNIKYLQEKIVINVKDCSKGGYDISEQDENSLLVVMRSIYMDNLTNTGQTEQEVAYMNHLVIKYCVDNIIVNIKQYIHYLKSISKLPVPMEHPKYMRPDGLKKYRHIVHF